MFVTILLIILLIIFLVYTFIQFYREDEWLKEENKSLKEEIAWLKEEKKSLREIRELYQNYVFNQKSAYIEEIRALKEELHDEKQRNTLERF